MTDSIILSVSNLRKSYGAANARNIVIDDLSFALKRGECYGLLGPNGAGKTTTLRLCLGLTTADSGKIMMAGRHIPVEARPAAYSTETGHPNRRKPDTQSSANWTRIPRQTGHYGRNDAGSRFGFYS